MAATGVFRGIVVRNDSSGVWVHTRHANGDDMGDMPQPCLVTPGTIVTVGAPVIVGFEQNVRNYPVILGNYGPTYVPPGTLLQTVLYSPAELITYNLTTSLGAPDSTNLTIGFEAPSSGNILACANICGAVTPPATTAAAAALALCFLLHGTTTQASPLKRFLQGYGLTSSADVGIQIDTCDYQCTVKELTPGTTYQFDLGAIYSETNSGGSAVLYVDNGVNTAPSFVPVGPALLSIYAA